MSRIPILITFRLVLCGTTVDSVEEPRIADTESDFAVGTNDVNTVEESAGVMSSVDFIFLELDVRTNGDVDGAGDDENDKSGSGDEEEEDEDEEKEKEEEEKEDEENDEEEDEEDEDEDKNDDDDGAIGNVIILDVLAIVDVPAMEKVKYIANIKNKSAFKGFTIQLL